VVAYLWFLPITYNRMVYLCVADKRMHDRRAWYSKPGKKPTKEVPPNVDALVHAATLAAHDLAVAEFGCLLYSKGGVATAEPSQKACLRYRTGDIGMTARVVLLFT
jgi:hypothetical protein